MSVMSGGDHSLGGGGLDGGGGHFADRVLRCIEEKEAPVCVGLDPVFEKLPDVFRVDGDSIDGVLAGIRGFCVGVLDAVAEWVPVVKFQAACFERYRGAGVELLYELIGEAKRRGLVVILDCKRGDIGISAAHYAAGIFGGDESPDAVTINGYMGMDTVEPFVVEGCGVFVLVRTSNAGSDLVQGIETVDGGTVAERIANLLNEVADKHIGESGYSSIGVVVGATKASEIARLRKILPRSLFLVPGYGAQGGSAEDVRGCFDEYGRGAIITASRSVIYGFDEGDGDWVDGVRHAARLFHEEIRGVCL